MRDDIIVRVNDILVTVEEGFNHIVKQTAELRYEEAFTLLQDLLLGISSVEEAVFSSYDLGSNKAMKDVDADFKESISKAVKFYEEKDESRLEGHFRDELLPLFKAWNLELGKIIKAS